jgi:two-component system response regulator AtoC
MEVFLKCVHKLKIIDPAIPILTSIEEDGLLAESTNLPFEGIQYFNLAQDIDRISRTIDCALNFKMECQILPELPAIIGQSPRIVEIREKVKKIADKDITVLVTGETGTGKELIARSIHYHSKRNRGPLVKINCGSLPDELLESEVFGFQKGAFTDASRNKPGRLELAHEGTLFIDEIGDLSISIQVKFLQVLEDKVFSRLGATQDKTVDARVVAATNADLWTKVKEGSFREDLFYRLNVVHIEALPLRDRKEDIPLLIHYFMNKYCFEFKRDLLETPPEIRRLFEVYQWPGNVRELENIIRRAIVVRNWDFISEELDMEKVRDGEAFLKGAGEGFTLRSFESGSLEELFEENDLSLKKICKAYVSGIERKVILDTLEATDWNRKKTAQMLQVSYKTLLNRILEFDLKPT